MKWAVGVTTVPERRNDLLPRTLASLALAGFKDMRLFVDGIEPSEGKGWGDLSSLEVTTRWPRIRTAGNWILGMWEIYVREPNADRYAMFQDDLIASKGLREYLERTTSHQKAYWNLYTFPMNEEIMAKGSDGKPKMGWHQSNQRGKGAVGLVFTNEGARALLCSRHMVDRCDRDKSPETCWRNIDGGVVTAMGQAGFKEVVHFPTLVMHVGLTSTTRTGAHVPIQWQSTSFKGEEFDLMSLLK